MKRKHELKKNQQNKLTLLRHVAMPEDCKYGEASISVNCSGVTFPEDIKVKSKEKRETAEGVITDFAFKPTPFVVHYKLNAKYDPSIDIDVAGNPGNLKFKGMDEAEDAEKEEWLDQARGERTELEKSDNGQLLLEQYDENKDAYNLAFTSKTFCNKWQEGNVVMSMSRDTSEALKTGGVINEKTYEKSKGKTVTYNDHAYDVQSCLQNTLIFMKKNPAMNSEGEPGYVSPEDIDKAVHSMTEFYNAVYTTGNTKDKTTPMTRDQVYEAVENTHANRLMATNARAPYEEFEYYQERLKNKSNGLLRADKDKYGHEEFFRSLVAEQMMRSDEAGVVVHEGEFKGVIPDDDFTMSVLIQKENGETSGIKVLSVNIPDLELDVDSEKWAEEYKEILEDKMRDVTFVQHIIKNALSESTGQIVCGELARHENIKY